MLSELDHCVLAVIWRDGPITAYGVRSVFKTSTTVSWSSSSGSIYPAIRRLVAAGMVEAAAATDKRRTQPVAATEAGREELTKWLLPLPAGIGSATPDPIRTRIQFLTTLPEAQRVAFLTQAKERTQAAIDEVAPWVEATRDRPDRLLLHLGDLGALYELRARMAWLEEASDLIARHDPCKI